MTTIYEYRVWCNTESAWKKILLKDGQTVVCPDNSGHTIDAAKTVVIQTIPGINAAALTEEGAILAYQQVSTPGMRMCNRDFKITTAKVTQATAIEDMKANVTTHVREAWAGPECKLVAVKKDDGGGGYTDCTDQTDADVNASLTIVEYQAIDQSDGTTPIRYDLRGGCLGVDDVLGGANQWDHQLYAIAAPDIPAANGGVSRFFDGYLKPQMGSEIQSINPGAYLMDPSVSAAAAILRLWFYYPAGTVQNHILRLITYRDPGTM